jgi:hypothetical protein
MQITITKGANEDTIEAFRGDGASVRTHFPKKGPLPHDAVHYVVESELGIAEGFWGLVASGRHPEEIAGLAKAAGHASASRARRPDPAIIPMVQAERAVECFEADLWDGGGTDADTLREALRAGCEQSLVPMLPLENEAIRRIRARIAALRQHWATLPIGGSCSFEWPEVRAAA